MNYIAKETTKSAEGIRGFSISDPISGYVLNIEGLSSRWEYKICFDIPSRWKDNAQPIMVTGRDYSQYPKLYRVINPLFQYIEVGAGLSGYLPFISEKCLLKKRPIVIDPVKYEVLQTMMLFAKTGGFVDEKLISRLETLIDRTRFYLDSDKVWLINSTLHEAVRNHPELKGIADMVVDNCGARTYPQMTNYDDLKKNSFDKLLRWLKKK